MGRLSPMTLPQRSISPERVDNDNYICDIFALSMAQLAIYIDEKTAREINKASRKAGLSRSEWVSQVVKKELQGKLKEAFFQVLGTWEDDRSPEEILIDIRTGANQRERPPLR